MKQLLRHLIKPVIAIFCFLLLQCNIKEESRQTVCLLTDQKATLGEGALWDHQKQLLYWIDIENGVLYTHKPSTNESKTYNMGSRIGTVVPVQSGGVLVALEKGIYKMGLQDTSMQLIAHPERNKTGNRYNDGKCGPAGRFWVGSMSTKGKKKHGALYCLDRGKIHKKIDSVSISNGIVWSKDKTKMYYIDTPTREVREYNYDDKTGAITYNRVAVRIPDGKGYPDGMAIDSKDNLWIALWAGECVTCWNPENGTLLKEIKVPALNVTSCAFGGKNLDKLFITTARAGMNEEQLEKYPLSGSVFVADPGVKGVESSFYIE
jgi:sugar lactone lactonase YvrE